MSGIGETDATGSVRKPLEPSSKATFPIRGSLRLTVNASSPQVTAGADFSIFVIIQNPFELPITIYRVQTHIPVELVDVNGTRLYLASLEADSADRLQLPIQIRVWPFVNASFNLNLSAVLGGVRWIVHRLAVRQRHTGTAIAVGTDFGPKLEQQIISAEIHVGEAGERSTVAGIMFQFPQNPSAEELDRLFRRLEDYKTGLIPDTLQPGDSVVKQFVLRTRNWLFFTPLTHRFQIQVNYSADGVDHTDTISYEQTIRSGIPAVAIGAAVGAIVGTFLKTLMASPAGNSAKFLGLFGESFLAALAVSLLASLAVVVAFARKSSAQPIVSVEDFWGGSLIGFSTSFFGFDQFLHLFQGGKT
jgi:hypothetical protein